MMHEYEKTRRHAQNTIAEANRHLDRGVRSARNHQMLTSMIKDATATLDNLDRMDAARPYSDTNIGYGANTRSRGRTSNDATDMVRSAMDAINRVLPRIIDDDRYDVDNRRGVPGTGRGKSSRTSAARSRYEMDNRSDMDDRYDDRYDDDDMDDLTPVDMPRWRSRRTGRFLPNLYGPRRVRRVRRRRADMDDDMNYADDYNNDARYESYDDDDDYNEMRRAANEARQTANDARRTANEARRAAEDARRMADDARGMRSAMPVMANDDARSMRYDARNDARSDMRSDATSDLSDRMRRPGPGMRE